MTKKTFSKVIAMVCVAALLLGAVFTGAVSAESATCTVTGYKYSQGAVDAYVTYEVTFASSTAFTAGSFTITPATDLSFVDCTAKVSSQSGYVPKVYLNVNNNKVLFAGFEENNSNSITEFTSLTLVLMFTPDTAIADSAAGKSWSITVGSISITNAAEATFSCDNASGTAHVHNFGAWSGSGVETRTCSTCSAVDKRVQTGATLGSNSLVSAGNNRATLQFTAEGDTVLCALVAKNTVDSLGGTTYFSYKYKDDTADLKYATTTKRDETVTMSGIIYYVFPCGRNGGIGRMSRNITGNFINVNGGTTTISAEWSYSIMSYLTTLINGNDTKSQNYAKALWNYGYYTTQRLKATQPGFFDAELAAYNSTTYDDITGWDLPASKTASSSGATNGWTISGIKVKTGFNPKMMFKFSATGTATIQAYSTAGDLVYKKTITVTDTTDFVTISDIPTKYLTGDIKVSMSSNDRVITYSFGRYAKAKAGTDDANVFLWLMRYSYYLGVKFA